MKRPWVVGLIALFGLLPAVLAGGRSTTTMLLAKIPFEFTVGDQAYPAGEYHVRYPLSSNPAVLGFGSGRGTDGYALLTNTVASLGGNPSLEFRLYRYRGQNDLEQRAYFLYRVNAGPWESGRELLRSSSEKAIEREARLHPMASASSSAKSWQPEVVTVAASR